MSRLVAAARAYLGVPFRHHGRSRAGLDCAGLALVASADIGHAYADEAAYPRQPVGNRLGEVLAREMGAPVTSEPQAGDVVLIRFGRQPQHVAIVGYYPLGGLSLIHTDSILGRVTEHRLDPKWRRRIVAIHRPAE